MLYFSKNFHYFFDFPSLTHFWADTGCWDNSKTITVDCTLYDHLLSQLFCICICINDRCIRFICICCMSLFQLLRQSFVWAIDGWANNMFKWYKLVVWASIWANHLQDLFYEPLMVVEQPFSCMNFKSYVLLSTTDEPLNSKNGINQLYEPLMTESLICKNGIN